MSRPERGTYEKIPEILVQNRAMAKILQEHNRNTTFRVVTKSPRSLNVGVICADNLQVDKWGYIPPPGFEKCAKHIFYTTRGNPVGSHSGSLDVYRHPVGSHSGSPDVYRHPVGSHSDERGAICINGDVTELIKEIEKYTDPLRCPEIFDRRRSEMVVPQSCQCKKIPTKTRKVAQLVKANSGGTVTPTISGANLAGAGSSTRF